MVCDELEAAQEMRERRRDALRAASLARVTDPEVPGTASQEDAAFFLSHSGRMLTRMEHVGTIRRSVLGLAVQGRLVHTASWREARLRDVISFGPRNGLSPRASTDPNAPKCLALTATTSGVFKSAFFKNVDAHIPLDSHLWLRSGDILFQRGNTRDYVGIAALFDGPDGSFIYPDLMIKVRTDAQVDPRWLVLAANSPLGRRYMAANAVGAQKSMPKINHEILLNLPVPLPPLTDQVAVLDRVSELMAVCDELERSLVAAEEGRTQALEAVLHRALEGAGAPLPELLEVAG
jgi:type I restriction enzyme, S subunit